MTAMIKRMKNNSAIRVGIVNGRVVSLIVKNHADGSYMVEALYEREEKSYSSYTEARDAALAVKTS